MIKYPADMPKPLVTDELWTVVEPLLPKQPPKPKGGRPRVNDRAALRHILFVLNYGLRWAVILVLTNLSTIMDRSTADQGGSRFG